MNKIRKSQKVKKNFWPTGKVLEMLPHLKKNGAANVRKIGRIYHTIFRSRCPGGIVAKKRDPGILDPEPFLAQIRKVEARLGKLAKIRKVETD